MLTIVRERVEKLDIAQMLEEKGYWYGDQILDSADILVELQKEGEVMLQEDAMNVDMEELGHGQFVCSLQGGREQYVLCPRSVELVVSATKHILKDLDNVLDKNKCMGTMRTFDRNAMLASSKLLTGEEVAFNSESSNEYTLVVKDAADLRAYTLLYFMVPESWDEECKGGITFAATGETVRPKRDRLVLWRSGETSYRREMWNGNDDMPLASCIELHLIKK
jgi:hypothetical protein